MFWPRRRNYVPMEEWDLRNFIKDNDMQIFYIEKAVIGGSMVITVSKLYIN